MRDGTCIGMGQSLKCNLAKLGMGFQFACYLGPHRVWTNIVLYFIINLLYYQQGHIGCMDTIEY
jgi:hypothetical protein